MQDNLLNDEKLIERSDSENYYHKIIHMPENIYKTYNSKYLDKEQVENLKPVEKIIVITSAQTAVAAKIIKAAFSKYIAIDVCNFDLPVITENTLGILLDNNPEINDHLGNIEKRTSKLILLTSRSEKKDCIKINLPRDYDDQTAMPILFFIIVKLLEELNLISSQAVLAKSLVAMLVKKAGAIAAAVPLERNLAKSLAMQVFDKIPVIITSNYYSLLAEQWQNAIIHYAAYPVCSFMHEEYQKIIQNRSILDFTKDHLPIILNDIIDPRNKQQKLADLKQILKSRQIEFIDLYMEGSTYLEKIYSLIYLGDMIAFYLSILEKNYKE